MRPIHSKMRILRVLTSKHSKILTKYILILFHVSSRDMFYCYILGLYAHQLRSE